MSKSPETQSTIPEIPGVDQLPTPEPGAVALTKFFFVDEIELMVSMAKKFRSRHRQGQLFIAPEGIGFTIYRRSLKA